MDISMSAAAGGRWAMAAVLCRLVAAGLAAMLAFAVPAQAAGAGTRPVGQAKALGAPEVTSPDNTSGLSGEELFYQITATNDPTSFNASGLPPGLSVDTATGVISGTPTKGGTFDAVVSATNAAGTGTLGVQITIISDPPVTQDVAVEVRPDVPTAIQLPVTGDFTQVTIVVAPEHGTVTTPPPGIRTVVYTPAANFSGADGFSYSAEGPGGPSQTSRVSITVAATAPVARPVALEVPLNTPTTVDLSPYISGTGVRGIAIATAPTHGTAEVNGTRLTYSPKQDYFGPDAFTYYAIGIAGSSPPAPVTITVGGRPDPSKDRNVVALLGGQGQVAQRFARAQISNIQRRLESLHVDPPSMDAPAARAGPTPPAASLAPAAGQDAARRPASSTVNLANSSDRGAASGGSANGFGVWIGGNASFGTQDSSERSAGWSFSTDGITVGGDWRASEALLLGLAGGYAQDKTHFGNDGTQMKSDGYSVAAYAGWRPGRNTFVDALLGYGTLDFDTDRYVASVDDFASARRKGSQVFGSVAGGVEFRNDSVLVSPYGRLDFTFDRFKQATESGAGLNALTYQDQTQRSVQFSLGLRAESQHAADFGQVRPRMRAEYRHDFEGAGDASIAYADGFGGRTYTVTPVGTKRDFVLLGVGSDFLFHGGLRLGFDYQWQSSGGADSGQMLRLLVSQELDGKGWPSPPWASPALENAVRVEGGYTFDDNVTRGRVSEEILSDKIYLLSASTDRTFPINDNTRVVVTGLLNGEMFHTYTGLARLSGGLQAELQYRGSADFDAVTYTAFARGFLDNYQSHLRDGGRWAYGISARRSLTDRIDLYGELSGTGRRAQSAVWDLDDYVARVNIDYSLGRRGTLYLTGEYRRGDTVSDGIASLENLSIAEVFVRDDAFPGDRLFAYRFDAKTWVGTLGWNLPLGPRDSIDFSWRRVESTPMSRPAFDSPGPFRYIDNQYSFVYLLRF